jgi:hypothetical protein
VILQGEVYDDGTGLPLSGAVVKLIRVGGNEPAEPAPTTMSTSEGKYLLLVPEGECIIRISKENYTYSDRKVISVSGFSSAVFDSRLAPITNEQTTLTPAGGVIESYSDQAITSGGSLYQTSTLKPGGIKGVVIYQENAVARKRQRK